MSFHSKLGASGAKCWTACTRSVSFVEENRDRIHDAGSIYALAGSHAHDYAKNLLKGAIKLTDVPEHDEEGKDLRAPIALYVATCKALIGKNATVYIEREVPLYFKRGDYGTVDFMSVTADEIHIRDYKHGEGVLVETDHNKQMAIYALSAIEDLEDSGLYDFEPDTLVSLQIIQPRHREWEDAPWVTTVAELREFCSNEITPAAVAILTDGQVVFAPSEDACRWCKAKAFCPARAAWLEALPSEINPLEHFSDLDAPDAVALSDEQLLSCYTHMKLITSFLDDVEEHLLERALAGNPLPGTKLVAGRAGNRKWVDPVVASVALAKVGLPTSDIWESSVRSPADLEKKLKAAGVDPKVLETICTRSPGKTVLALESDKRESVASPIEQFTNLDAT